MKLRNCLTFCLLLGITSLMMFPTLVFGQDAPENPVETMTKEGMWQYIIAIVTPFIVGGVRKLVPKIPPLLLPVSTPFVGLLVGFALNAVTGANLDALTMAKMGGLAVLIRESWDQAIKAGSGSSSPGGGSA